MKYYNSDSFVLASASQARLWQAVLKKAFEGKLVRDVKSRQTEKELP